MQTLGRPDCGALVVPPAVETVQVSQIIAGHGLVRCVALGAAALTTALHERCMSAARATQVGLRLLDSICVSKPTSQPLNHPTNHHPARAHTQSQPQPQPQAHCCDPRGFLRVDAPDPGLGCVAGTPDDACTTLAVDLIAVVAGSGGKVAAEQQLRKVGFQREQHPSQYHVRDTRYQHPTQHARPRAVLGWRGVNNGKYSHVRVRYIFETGLPY